MKPELHKAPEYLGEVTDVLACPEHPNNWIEASYTNSHKIDTAQFCNCCTMDCSASCMNCEK
jgi:hypothetical protein